MTYFDLVKPTYIEQWPAAVCSLSIAQVNVPLTRDEAIALGNSQVDYFEFFGEQYLMPTDDRQHLLTEIEQRVRVAVSKQPKGAFIRLGSRSPKDSFLGHRHGLRVTTEDAEPLRFLLDASERVNDDLLLALAHDYEPHIWVREWLDIPKWAELRCFMRDRKLIGVSQYNYRDDCPELREHLGLIQWAFEQWFPLFRDACHLDDVVFDLFPIIKTRGNEQSVELKLLEINPYGEFTDPCLFSWTGGGDFDGTWRIKE